MGSYSRVFLNTILIVIQINVRDAGYIYSVYCTVYSVIYLCMYMLKGISAGCSEEIYFG